MVLGTRHVAPLSLPRLVRLDRPRLDSDNATDTDPGEFACLPKPVDRPRAHVEPLGGVPATQEGVHPTLAHLKDRVPTSTDGSIASRPRRRGYSRDRTVKPHDVPGRPGA
jgi:hypothetical protein